MHCFHQVTFLPLDTCYQIRVSATRMRGGDGGHESRGPGSIYTPASHPRSVTPHSPPSLSLSSAPPRELRHLRRATAENLAAGSIFRHKLASSSSSSLEILEVLTATPLAAMEPESPRQASKSEAAEGSARSSDTESAIPETSGGDWDSCNLSEEVLSSLEREGRISAKEVSRWRVELGEAMPAPSDEEVVMLKSTLIMDSAFRHPTS
jgi:hypothetical protein